MTEPTLVEPTAASVDLVMAASSVAKVVTETLDTLTCDGVLLENRLVLVGKGATFPEAAWQQWTRLYAAKSTRAMIR